jgi:ribosome-binding protein aMBF1 (putative translation factor)
MMLTAPMNEDTMMAMKVDTLGKSEGADGPEGQCSTAGKEAQVLKSGTKRDAARRQYEGGREFAEWLIKRRHERKLSREALAVRAQVSIGTICRAEQGKKILAITARSIRETIGGNRA